MRAPILHIPSAYKNIQNIDKYFNIDRILYCVLNFNKLFELCSIASNLLAATLPSKIAYEDIHNIHVNDLFTSIRQP